MKSFHFALERVLEWRRSELDLAEARFREQMAVLAGIEREQAEMEAAGIRAEIQVRQWRPVSGSDLAALAGFRLQTKAHEKTLSARRTECARELAGRQTTMLEARRRLRLLERLKERRLAEWRAVCDRDLEEQAAELYLARFGAAKAVAEQARGSC